MKVSIIGGGGLVGSSAGFALQCGGVVREIALLDVNLELAQGQALDLLHGGPSTADQVITAGGYEHVPSSDVICITAGLRRKPVTDRSQDAEGEKLPQEPLRSAGPERQSHELLPIVGDARLGCGREIGRIERDRHQDEDGRDERQAEPQQAATRPRSRSTRCLFL